MIPVETPRPTTRSNVALVISPKRREFENIVGQRLAETHADVIHLNPEDALELVADVHNIGHVCLDGSCSTQQRIVKMLMGRGHTSFAFMPANDACTAMMGRFLAALPVN